MIPIYLCDDDPNVRRAMRDELEKEILISGYDMKVVCDAGTPDELLSAVRENGKRGICFLDVDLKDAKYTGFTLGQEVRKEDPRGFLIYVTAYGELAFETFRYKLEAMDYIVKDDPAEMFRGIRRCLKVAAERMADEREENREYFTVKFMDTVRHIPIDEILYFETGAKSHRIILHGTKGTMDFTGSIRELQKSLGGQFLRVHRAYLANVRQIREIDMREKKVVFANGDACLFSRQIKNRLLSLQGNVRA